MWWNEILKYSKYYIRYNNDNVQLVPLKIHDKKLLEKYSEDIVLMYNEFQYCNSLYDLPELKSSIFYKYPIFVKIEDLLKTTLNELNVEFSVILIEGELIGFISYKVIPDNHLSILDAWISCEYRNHGFFSIVHRILRRLAITSNCKYMDILALKNNYDAINKYKHIGYKPYLSTYVYVFNECKNHGDFIQDTFTIIKVNNENINTYIEDIKNIWHQYYTSEYGILVDINRNFNIKEQVDIKKILIRNMHKLTFQLFYMDKRVVGVIVFFKSDSEIGEQVQLNDFYFIKDCLDKYHTLILTYVKNYVKLNYKVSYFSMFSIKNDYEKRTIYRLNGLIHRANNLYLNL